MGRHQDQKHTEVKTEENMTEKKVTTDYNTNNSVKAFLTQS